MHERAHKNTDIYGVILTVCHIYPLSPIFHRMGLILGGAAGTYQTVTGIARDMFLKDRNSSLAPALGGLASGAFLGATRTY